MEDTENLLDYTDSPFNELLVPHRDRAANWGIDIARRLIDYAQSVGIYIPSEEVEDQRLSSDSSAPSLHGHSSTSSSDASVDFAHAALILQGSTNIYSKKVEHLYDLVCSAVGSLDTLNSKTAGNSSGNADCNKNLKGGQSFDIDTVDFLKVTEEDIEQADPHQITIQPDNDNSSENSSEDPTRLRPIPPMLSQSLSGVTNTNLERSKFKVYSAVLHSSGALLTEGCPAVDENLEAILKPRPLHLLSLSNSTSSPSNDQALPCDIVEHPVLLSDDERDDTNSVFNDQSGLYPDADGAPPPFQSQTEDNSNDFAASLQGSALKSNPGLTSIPRRIHKRDPFELLDPHSPDPQHDRPIRVGKTYRLPQVNRKRRKFINPSTISALNVPKLLGMLLGPVPRNASSATYTYTAAARTPLRALIRGRCARRFGREPPNETLFNDFEDTLSDMEEIHRSGGDGLNEGNGLNANDVLLFDDEHDEGGLELNDVDENDDILPVGLLDNDKLSLGLDRTSEIAIIETSGRKTRLDNDLEKLASSYGEACQEYLKKTAWMWEQKMVDTNLVKRVFDWSSKILPILEREENRQDFDIRKYGESVLSRLQAIEHHDGVTPRAKMSVLLREQEQFEVSRLFLATLQLTNQYSVGIDDEWEPCSVSDPVVELLVVDGSSVFNTPSGGVKRKRMAGTTPLRDKRLSIRARTQLVLDI